MQHHQSLIWDDGTRRLLLQRELLHMSLSVLSNFSQEAVNTPYLQMIEKAHRPYGEGSLQVTWTCTKSLGVVERGLAETEQLMEAGRGQIVIWTIDPDYPHFQLVFLHLKVALVRKE